MSGHPLDVCLHPNSIAVAGASGEGRGGAFLSPLLELGFKGAIYPVNPKYAGQDIMGLKTYATVRDCPGPVDFVTSSIPASQVLNLIDDCAAKGVKCIHFFTARFSETGRPEAVALEREVLRRAKEANIRIIGPNCMGVYYPGWGISFNNGMPKQSGNLGCASQSGSAVHEIVDLAVSKGCYFTKAISYGNAIDLNESDYLEYFAQDEDTKVIIMYIEGVRDGPRFFRTLRETTLKKPVVIIKGGRGKAGTRATASHTASLAGAMEVWHTMVRQAGAVEVATIEELTEVAAAFYFLPPIYRNHAAVVGGSGGSSVMGADQCEEAGLNVVPLPDEIREELKRRGSPIWDWISNPADFSIAMESFNTGEIVQLMADHPDFDMIITYMNPPHNFGPRRGPLPTIEEHLQRYSVGQLKKPVFVVLQDRGHGTNDEPGENMKKFIEFRDKLIEMRLPTYPTIGAAANAAAKVVAFYQNRNRALASACL